MTAEASCNRCGGDGTVSLQDQDITCPQCKGTGTGENNAGQDAADLLSANSVGKLRRDMHGIPETRVSSRSEFELREVPNGTGGTNLRFTGFASTTDTEYEMEDWLGPFVESVSSGAFRKTLSEGADVAFLLNHQGMTLARTKSGTLKLSEETDGKRSPVYGVTGLHSEALLDPTNMHVQTMRSAVDRGDLDEMSFAFRVMRQEWNAEYDRRWINEVSLDKGDVSLVNYGANPTTGGTVSIRQRFFGRTVDPMPADRIRHHMTAAEALSLRDRANALVLPDYGDRARADLEALRHPARRTHPPVPDKRARTDVEALHRRAHRTGG